MILFSDLSPLLVPILLMLIPIVGIIAWAAIKITRMHLLHETVRHLSSNGQPIPPELLNQIVSK